MPLNNKSRGFAKSKAPRPSYSRFTKKLEGFSFKTLKGLESNYLKTSLGIKLLSLRKKDIKYDFLGDKNIKFLCKFSYYLTITNPTINYDPFIIEYIKWFVEEETHKKKTEVCKIAKLVAGVHLRHAAGHDFKEVPFMKTNDRKLPLRFSFILPLIEGTVSEAKSGLCILDLYKLIGTSEPVYDSTSIVGCPEVPFTKTTLNTETYLEKVCLKRGLRGDPIIESLLKAWKEVISETFPIDQLAERLRDISKLSTLHVTSKSGPNGPALLTIKVDYCAIKKTPILDGVKWFANALDIKYLKRLLENLALEDNEPVSSKGTIPCTSRISLKQEPGGKNRLFAIGDFFTQCALKGLHKWAARWLHSRKEDGTSSHNRVSQVARQMSKDINLTELYSTDLRLATDTIPVEAQGELVCAIGGEIFAHKWVDLLTDRDFIGPNGETLRYNTGQPMGILSSWAMMAIWNHIVTLTCFKALGLPYDNDKTEYLVIGDDKADSIKEVAKLYRVLLDLFRVQISPLKGYDFDTKSDKSDPINGKSVIEIAKRVFINGEELTPVSPVLISQSFKDADAFPSLLRELDMRGYTFEEPPALALSKLCNRARLAIHLATFPAFKAPLTGLTEDEDGNVIVPENLKDLIWYSDQPNSVYKATSLFESNLRQRLNECLSDTYQTLNGYLIRSVSDSNQTVKEWSFESSSQLGVYKLVYDNCLDTVNSIMMDVTNKLDTRLYFTGLKYEPLGLKALIGKLKIAFDLNDLLKGEDIDHSDEKDYSSGMIGTIISEMLQ